MLRSKFVENQARAKSQHQRTDYRETNHKKYQVKKFTWCVCGDSMGTQIINTVLSIV